MEELELEQNLQQSRGQLEQIELLMSTMENPDPDGELNTLKRELQELIKLTEENLLKVKKDKLLQMVNSGIENIEDGSTKYYDEDDSSGNDCNVRSDDDDNGAIDNEEWSVGSRCMAPYSTTWSGTQYHQAVVSSKTNAGAVKVLFSHPTMNSMKPCSYYLQGECRYSDTECKYSHGYEVSVSLLQNSRTIDFSNIAIGTRCLALCNDLYVAAKVIDIVQNKYVVQFDENNDHQSLLLHQLVPLADEDTDSDGESSDDDDGAYRCYNIESYVNPVDTQTTARLGGWEKHTKGIGSLLLSNMGYVTGQGLGKHQQGRAEPIPIVKYPQGKSLDECMQLKVDGKDGSEGQRKPKRKKGDIISASTSSSNTTKKGNDVFDYLNTQLNREVQEEKPSCSWERHEKNSSSKELGVKSFKLSEERKQLELEVKKLEQAKIRNKGKDKQMYKHIEKKLETVQQQIERNKKSEERVMLEEKRRKVGKKITVF